MRLAPPLGKVEKIEFILLVIFYFITTFFYNKMSDSLFDNIIDIIEFSVILLTILLIIIILFDVNVYGLSTGSFILTY